MSNRKPRLGKTALELLARVRAGEVVVCTWETSRGWSRGLRSWSAARDLVRAGLVEERSSGRTTHSDYSGRHTTVRRIAIQPVGHVDPPRPADFAQ